MTTSIEEEAGVSGVREIEATVRTLARTLRRHSQKSLHLIVDADGTFAYEPVSQEILANRELAHLELDLLLQRREDMRAKYLGVGTS